MALSGIFLDPAIGPAIDPGKWITQMQEAILQTNHKQGLRGPWPGLKFSQHRY